MCAPYNPLNITCATFDISLGKIYYKRSDKKRNTKSEQGWTAQKNMKEHERNKPNPFTTGSQPK